MSRRELLAVAGAAVALVAYLLAPLPVVAIALAGMVVGVAAIPLAGPLAIVLSLPFSPLTRTFGSLAISPTEALLGAAMLAWVIRALSPRPSLPGAPSRPVEREIITHHGGEGRQTPSPRPRGPTRREGVLPGGWRARSPHLAAIALVLVGLVSLFVSEHPRESLRMFRLVILEPVIFYGLLVSALSETGDRLRAARRLALMLAVGGSAISVIGIVHYVAGVNLITAEGVWRIRGYYGSPNNLALFLDRSLPLTLGLALGAGTIAPGYLALAAVQALALLLTFSVGGWLATAAAVVLLAAFRGRRPLLLTLAAIALVLAIAWPLASSVERIRGRFDLGEGTSFLRLQVWQSAAAMLRDHPLGGIGLDNFLYYYRDGGYMLPAAWREPNLSHPHNVVLDFWLSLGVWGLAVLGWLSARLARGLAHLRRQWPSGDGRALAEGLAAAMLASLVHGLVDNSYFLPDLAMLFWAIFGIVGVLVSHAAASTEAGVSRAQDQSGVQHSAVSRPATRQTEALS